MSVNPKQKVDIFCRLIWNSYDSPVRAIYTNRSQSRVYGFDFFITSMENNSWSNLEAEKHQVRFLYVEADEDHVHKQKSKGIIMKLAYMHGGKHLVNPSSKSKHERKKLIGLSILRVSILIMMTSGLKF